jgi:hypothetical protein
MKLRDDEAPYAACGCSAMDEYDFPAGCPSVFVIHMKLPPVIAM